LPITQKLKERWRKIHEYKEPTKVKCCGRMKHVENELDHVAGLEELETELGLNCKRARAAQKNWQILYFRWILTKSFEKKKEP